MSSAMVRTLVLAVLASSLLVAATAQAAQPPAGKCVRGGFGIECKVWYKPAATGSSGMLRFSISNKSDVVLVQTPGGSKAWLDGTDDTSGRTWAGRLGRHANRRDYKLWRACAPDFKSRKTICTGWAWQGPV